MVTETTERIAIEIDLAVEKMKKNARSAANEIRKLERRFDPLGAATTRLEKKQRQMNAAFEAGTLDMNDHMKGLSLIQREYDETAARIGGARSNVVAMNSSVASQTGFMHRNRNIFQQAGYQVGDFAVQVQGGTSAVTAFTQQGSQMLGVFGAYGAVAGAVLAVGAPLIATFLSNGEAAGTFGDALGELEEALAAYQSAAEASQMTNVELAESYGKGAEVLRGSLHVLREIAEANAIEALSAAAVKVVEDFGDVEQSLKRLEILELQGAGSGTAYRRVISDLKEEYNLTVDQAQKLNAAIQAVGSATGPDEVASKSRDLQAVLLNVYGTVSDMPEVFRTMAKATANVDIQAEQLKSTIEDTEFTALDLVDAFSSGAGALGSALPNADALLGRVQALATAAWSYAGALGANAPKGGRGGDPTKQGGSLKDWNDPKNRLIVNSGSRPSRAPSAARRGSGGVGGGGSGRSEKPLFGSSDDELQSLQRQIEMLGKSKSEVAALTVKYKLLDEAKKRGLIVTDELSAKIDTEAANVGRLADQYELARDKIAALEQIQGQFKDSVIDAAMGGANAMDQFTKSLKRAAIEYAFFGSGLFAGGKKSGGFGGIFGGVLGSLIPGFANGTNNAPGGLATINERGGEIVNLPSGAQVIPNDISKRMADASAAAVVRVEIVNPVITATDDGTVMMQARAQVASGINENNKRLARGQRTR
tara:strand:- start:4973 stop:7093 length:2121 start_codon:yes stop_codon:yes gene_type:complete